MRNKKKEKKNTRLVEQARIYSQLEKSMYVDKFRVFNKVKTSGVLETIYQIIELICQLKIDPRRSK